MMKRRKNVYKRYHYLIIAFMSVFSVIMMYPMAWMLVTSFKSNADIHKNKEKFFPAEWTVEGYRISRNAMPKAISHAKSTRRIKRPIRRMT